FGKGIIGSVIAMTVRGHDEQGSGNALRLGIADVNNRQPDRFNVAVALGAQIVSLVLPRDALRNALFLLSDACEIGSLADLTALLVQGDQAWVDVVEGWEPPMH